MLTAGLVIGIVEEALYRGALQPRFGLLLTSLLFVVARSSEGITLVALTSFLIAGVILGLLRVRFNTTACVIAHSAYNITRTFAKLAGKPG